MTASTTGATTLTFASTLDEALGFRAPLCNGIWLDADVIRCFSQTHNPRLQIFDRV